MRASQREVLSFLTFQTASQNVSENCRPCPSPVAPRHPLPNASLERFAGRGDKKQSRFFLLLPLGEGWDEG
jgi:hypothetical protein